MEILSFDPERKRIGVAVIAERSVRAPGSLPGSSGAAGDAASGRLSIVAGARIVGKVERHEKYGVFVFLAPGRTGLVPIAETGVERESDLQKRFPVGSDLEVMVLEIDPSSRRIRLSHKAVHEAEEKREVLEYTENLDREQGEGFGSLADKLRTAMRRTKS